MTRRDKLKEVLRPIIKTILKEQEDYGGFPPTITHPTFGVMKIMKPFKIKGKTYYTYGSRNHVIHADIEIANMYNTNAEK